MHWGRERQGQPVCGTQPMSARYEAPGTPEGSACRYLRMGSPEPVRLIGSAAPSQYITKLYCGAPNARAGGIGPDGAACRPAGSGIGVGRACDADRPCYAGSRDSELEG